jgi:DNA-binding NarL/FixJ family response regulator
MWCDLSRSGALQARVARVAWGQKNAAFRQVFVLDITELLPKVRTPTLILHARDDEVVKIEEGRLLATAIPGAEFIELDSRNHVLLEYEPAWQRFREAVLPFLRTSAAAADSVFAALSQRELQVLALMYDGLSNIDIAERLSISDKTVRNHVSNVFDKLVACNN